MIFTQQKVFDDCVYKSKLRFDFYLNRYNVIIEYDGIQHFEAVDFAGRGKSWANEQYKLIKQKDKIKNSYCLCRGIRLIRIPYYNYNNIEQILTSNLLEVF